MLHLPWVHSIIKLMYVSLVEEQEQRESSFGGLSRSPRKQIKPHRNSLKVDEPLTSPVHFVVFEHHFYNHAADPPRSLPVSSCVELLSKPSNTGMQPSSSCDSTIVSVKVDSQLPSCQSLHGFLNPKNWDSVCGNAPSMISNGYQSLSFLRDQLQCSYAQASYIQIVELITAVGMPSTPKEVTDVLIDLLKSDCNFFVDKLGNYLHQYYRMPLLMQGRVLLEIIEKSLDILQTAPGFLAGKTGLEFVLNVLISDIKMQRSPSQCSGLAEAMFLTSKWTWHNKFLKSAFTLISELQLPGNITHLECLDVVLSLALFPLVTCKSRIELESLTSTIAKELSFFINELHTTVKHLFLSRIPSAYVRLKVIDIHLDTYFTHSTSDRPEDFLLKYKDSHLKIKPGRQEVGYLLDLLTAMLQSYLFVTNGAPILPFLPEKAFDTSVTEFSGGLGDVHDSVIGFIDRLSSDPTTSDALIVNWHHLELLMTLTC